MAWLAEQRAKCPGCGMPLEICTDEKRRLEWEAVSDRCYVCQAREIYQANVAEEGVSPEGRLYRVERRGVTRG